MSTAQHYRRREKMFGDGRLLPLDRNAKVRIMTWGRSLIRRTEKERAAGKHYGELTPKFVEVLAALLWAFHNCHSGRCFPSYETIADKADCDPSTVYRAIHRLEKAKILTWVNRITRVKEWGCDLFGKAKNRVRVIRTSNAYTFNDPKPIIPVNRFSSNLQLQAGTEDQELIPSVRLTPQQSERPIFDNYDAALAASRARRVAFGAAKGLAM